MLASMRFWLLRIYDLLQLVNKVFYKTVMPFIIVFLPFWYFNYEDKIIDFEWTYENRKADAEEYGYNPDDFFIEDDFNFGDSAPP